MSYLSSNGSGGGGGSGILTLTASTGGAISPQAGNINLIGASGTTTAGDNTTATITITASGTITWNTISATSANMSVGNGYIANNGSRVTLTLPATASVGSNIRVAGKGTGGWSVHQNSGQTIHFGAVNTTTGTSGSLSSNLQYDTVNLLCITVDTDFVVLSAIGNLTAA